MVPPVLGICLPRAVPARRALLLASLLVTTPLSAQALPTGGIVVAGQASIGAPSAGQLQIDQTSARAVIDWSSFSVGAGGKVHFANGTGATLNRVLGGDPSSIAGQLSATGSLWLINPAGVLVAPDGRVTTGGSFVASTRSLAPAAFMAGDLTLAGSSTGAVVNAGQIAAGGDAVLIGHLVENRGSITAGGAASLLAADRVVLREAAADSRIHVEIAEGGAGDVTTTGRIEAAAAELRAVGGNVYALAADTSGIIRATGSRTEGGRILLVGGAGVSVGGTVDASGPKGGAIDVTAPGVHITSTARITAAGAEGDGGTIRIGGDRMGGPGLASADRLLVESGARIDAASTAAKGGTVILWSEDWTRFEGSILADGATGGGFVETSSRGELGIENGEVLVGDGQWLLDPRNVTITTSGFNPAAPYPNPFVINPPAGAGAYTINRAAIQNALNAGSNVTVTTTQAASSDPGNLLVSSSISWTGAGSLTLRADNDLTVSAGITSSGAGSLTLNATNNITVNSTLSTTGAGSITLDAGNLLTLGAQVSATGTGAISFTGRGAGITFTGSGNRTYRTNGGLFTLSAPGANGDILFGRTASSGNWQLYVPNGGALQLSAGRNIQIGRALGVPGWARIGRTADTGLISISAGNGLSLISSPVAQAFAEIQSGGTLSISAPNLLVQSTTQSVAAILSRGPSLSVVSTTANWNGSLNSTSNTTLAGGAHRFTVSPTFTLAANAGFTLAPGASITSTAALAITTSGTGDIRFNGTVSGTTLLARAGDEISIAAPISMSGAGSSLILAAGTRLINTAGQSLSAPNGRWLTYSVSPFNDVGWQDLNPDAPNLYGRSYGFVPPVSSPGTGNRRIYSFVPVLTFTADSATKTYGQAGPTLGYVVSGLVPGDSLAIALTTAPTVSSTGTPATAAVGNYATIASGALASGQGYGVAYVNGQLRVDPAPLTVVAAAKTREYGLADPALTFTATGFVNGQNASVLTGNLARAPGENVGVYAILQNNLSAANYAITYVGADFTITRAPLTVAAQSVTRLYGDPDPSPFTFTASGFRLSDTAATALTGSLARAPGENVGTYAITQGSLAAQNYAISFTPSQLGITPAPLDVNAIPQAKTYGQPDPAFTFTATGFRLSDTVASLSGALARTPGENVGVYDITQGTLSNPNYVISFSDAQFTINPATLSIVALPQTREYGLADPALTFTATGFQFADDASIITGGLVRAAGENVGAYAISQNGLAAPNYVIAFTGADFTITPAQLVITPGNVQVDAANLPPDPPIPFTAAGFRRGDTAATALTGALTRVGAGTNTPGDYAILPGTLTSTGNYSLSFNPGVFSVLQFVLSVTATDLRRLYGDPDPIFTFTATGFRPGDDASIFTGSLVRTPGENVGTYAITQGTLSAPGYTIAFTPGTFSIDPAPLSVAAFNATREYGLADPLPWAFSATGFRRGDTADTSLTGALARVSGNNVGDYAINQGSLAAQNYAISFTPGTLNITPATLTVVADDDSRTYGDPDPIVLTFNASGFRLGDSPSILTGALARDPGENVGSYVIRQGTLAAGGNYLIAYTPGNFRIDPATLSVIAANTGRLYGDPDPALTFSASGFVLGDTAATALTGGLGRTPGENVGTYAITQGSLAASNYLIDFTPGAFSINPAPLSVTALNATREYGLADALPFAFTASGFRLGDTESVLGGALARIAGENVGDYAINQGSLSASNYAISFTPGTLSITPATLSITADDISRVYGQPDPALTFNASGFRLSDTSAILSGALLRDPGNNVGSYTIRQGSLSAGGNYLIAFTPGTFSITQALLQVSADSLSRLYGDPDPVLSFGATGFVGGDTAATALTGSLARAPGENVGSYAVTQGSLASTNYAIAFTPGALAITPAPLSVAATPTSKTFGAADPLLLFTATGFRLSDTVASLSGALTRDPGENVGPYAITQGTLANPNYAISFTAAAFTIDPALLRITAIAQTREYGLADPLLGFTASGFQFADTAASVLTGGLVRASGEDVGQYAITQGSLAANANYTVQFAGALFSITPAPLAITANPASKVYGDADPLLGFQAAGFRLQDTAATVLSGAIARTPGETVAGSPYAITQGSLAANANYAIRFTGAAFSITQRLLTLQLAGTVSRTYDATVTATLTPPNLQLGGVLGADQVQAVASSARFDTADVGTGKLVTASGVTLTGAAAGNYTVAGTASAAIGTITPAPLIARALDATRPFGVPNPPFALQLTGLVGGDTSTSIGLEGFSDATEASPPGPYVIDVRGTPRNYTVTRVPGTLTVLSVPLITARALEFVEVPALGGLVQLGVATGVTAITDTLDTRSGIRPAPQPVLVGTRYTIAVQPSAPPAAGPPAGSSAFDAAAGIR